MHISSAFLYTIVSASPVFVMAKINMVSAGLLGDFKEKFWTWLFLGVSIGPRPRKPDDSA